MRELTAHKVNDCNDELKIEVMDEPGSGGAHHKYMCSFPNTKVDNHCLIAFQNGPIKEVGTNGLTHEALLTIVADRLECFQNGPYKCNDNAEALAAINLAQEILQWRTKARLARGVEGTHTV